MKTLLKTDEIYWDDFRVIGVTTHTPDYDAQDGQVLVQGYDPRNLSYLDNFPAYLEDGEDDEDGNPREVIRWYYGDECIAASYDLTHHIKGDDITDHPVVLDYGWLWETLMEFLEDETRSEEI